MARAGHFEFGLDRRPINAGDARRPRQAQTFASVFSLSPCPMTACAFGAERAAGGLPDGLAGAGATGGRLSVVQGGRQSGRAQSVEKAV
jgi:hypothetical protein